MTQQLVALVLVGMAAFYLVRQWVGAYRRIWKGESTGCGGGCGNCGCGAKASLPTAASQAQRVSLSEIGDFRRRES